MDSENTQQQPEETQQTETETQEVEQQEGQTETPEAEETSQEESAEAKGEEGETEGGAKEEGEPEAQKSERRRKGGWERKVERLERQNQELTDRLMALAQPQQQQPGPAAEKTPDEKAQEYVRSVAAQLLAEEREREQFARRQVEFQERTQAARAELPDFDDVLEGAAHLPVPQVLQQVLLTSPVGPKIMYQLAKSPAELARISRLPPLEAALEIGRLEARLTSSTPVQKAQPKPAIRPPPPPTTVGGSTKSTRDAVDLPIAEYKRRYRSGR